MAGKTDATTNIEAKVKAFTKSINAELEKLRKARAGKLTGDAAKKVPVVKFVLSKTKVSGSRTPAEQAALVVAGSTKVCWSAHMADKARHVLMKVDGKVKWKAKKELGDDFAAFKKAWGSAMKKHGLKNASGKDGWDNWDSFHLELAASKIARSSDRAKTCLETYANLTRKDGKKKNADFEKKYGKLLKPYFDKLEKPGAKKPAK